MLGSLPPGSPRSGSRFLADAAGKWCPPGPGKNYFSVFLGSDSPQPVSKSEFINLHQALVNTQQGFSNFREEAHGKLNRLEEKKEQLAQHIGFLKEELNKERQKNEKLAKDLEANKKAYDAKASEFQDHLQMHRKTIQDHEEQKVQMQIAHHNRCEGQRRDFEQHKLQLEKHIDDIRRDHDESYHRRNAEIDNMRLAHRERYSQLQRDHDEQDHRLITQFHAERCKLEQIVSDLQERVSRQENKLKEKASELEMAQEAHYQFKEERDKQVRGLEKTIFETRNRTAELELVVKELRHKLQEERKVQQIKDRVRKTVDKVVDDISMGRPVKESQRNVVAEIGLKYVVPHCAASISGTHWSNTVSAAGKCQECNNRDVSNSDEGLQCSNRGHWVCWQCLIKGVDWECLSKDQNLIDKINSNPDI